MVLSQNLLSEFAKLTSNNNITKKERNLEEELLNKMEIIYLIC